MRVILSNENIDTIQKVLLKCKNIPEVHDAIMCLPYFCFINIGMKKNIEELKSELLLFYSSFNKPLNIYVMHNECFYEYDGINRLNFFDYFRNIVEKDKTHVASVNNEVCGLVDNIIETIVSNNYNENEIVKIENKRL